MTSSFCENPFINIANTSLFTVDLLSKLYSHKLPFQVYNPKLETDYKRFIFLKTVTNDIDGTFISPTVEIDDVWHQHLLYNKDYYDMCIKINFIVFHYPQRSEDSTEVKDKRIDTFKQKYFDFFQNIPYGYTSKNKKLEEISELVYTVKAKPVQIFIKTVLDRTIVIEISLDDTIGELKQMIYKKEDISTEIQKFVFAGKYISYDNNKILRELNLEKNSNIHIMLMLKGC